MLPVISTDKNSELIGTIADDTIRLQFTAAFWAQADVQQDIENYLAFLVRVAANEEPSDATFSFSAFELCPSSDNLEQISV